MAERCLQLQYKIKTARSQKIENTYRENLQDLRLLLAKEYSGLILGVPKYIHNTTHTTYVYLLLHL